MNSSSEIKSFLEQWSGSPDRCRDVFEVFFNYLDQLEGSGVEFHARPGVTYSLRGVPGDESPYPLFVMIDVIEDQPRWLSICFYEQMVHDPEGRGDSVPGGLLGEDGICFDIESFDAALINYLKERIAEAARACR